MHPVLHPAHPFRVTLLLALGNLTIPPQLLARDSLTIRWIDFYRD
jgi:hypothetical protein